MRRHGDGETGKQNRPSVRTGASPSLGESPEAACPSTPLTRTARDRQRGGHGEWQWAPRTGMDGRRVRVTLAGGPVTGSASRPGN